MRVYDELQALLAVFEEKKLSYALCGGVAVRECRYDVDGGRIPFGLGTPEERVVWRISKVDGRDLLPLDLLLVNDTLADAWEISRGRRVGEPALADRLERRSCGDEAPRRTPTGPSRPPKLRFLRRAGRRPQLMRSTCLPRRSGNASRTSRSSTSWASGSETSVGWESIGISNPPRRRRARTPPVPFRDVTCISLGFSGNLRASRCAVRGHLARRSLRGFE